MVRVLMILLLLAAPAWADGLGDRRIDEVVDFPLSTGSNTNCDATPTVSVYEGNEATPSIRSAVNMTQRTAAGRYYYRETLSAANGYEVGKTYQVVYACTIGTVREAVDFFEVVPTPLAPTVPGRTLDVTATNKVNGVVLTDTVTIYTGNTPQTGDNYARLGAPSGASVSADIATKAPASATTAIQADTDDLQTRVPTALVSGRMDSSVGAMAADTLTAAAVADALESRFGYWGTPTVAGSPAATTTSFASTSFSSTDANGYVGFYVECPDVSKWVEVTRFDPATDQVFIHPTQACASAFSGTVRVMIKPVTTR